MKLVTKAAIQIQKSAEEVFEAIVDPEMMTKYFIAQSTGRLDADMDVKWKFPEFPDWYLVEDIKLFPNRSISFVWDPATVVTIILEPQSDGSTVVEVTEDGKEVNQENLDWLVSNAGGWANFLASLKAYLEYGIELRNGAFDYMKSKQ